MGLVDNEYFVPVQKAVLLNLGQQNAIGHDLQVAAF